MMTVEEFIAQWQSSDKCITVHTSGSTGKPKPMSVAKDKMLASAKITCDFLRLHPGDKALLCMPLDYIAGKMMVVRSIERDLELMDVTPSNHPLATVADVMFDLIAMVPSQVYCSLQVEQERGCLMRARNIIIGGGSISAELEEQLRSFPNAVWSTYGMTETLSHIALRRLNGMTASSWYRAFDSVRVSLADDGCLCIDAPLVCKAPLKTNDIAELHPESPNNTFRIIGRKDNVICSGGVKLQIEEIEEKLKPHLHQHFAITKRKDAKFGEIVVMVVERDEDSTYDLSDIVNICQSVLPKYCQPKDYVVLDEIPMTETGKVRRKELEGIY